MDYKNINFEEFGRGRFPEYLGVEVIQLDAHKALARMQIKPHHFAPNDYLHAGTIVTLADTIAGYGCLYHLPETAKSFTTIELKTNFSGTAKSGAVYASAELVHGGRSTQVWDVKVTSEESGKTIALFRCTQMILY